MDGFDNTTLRARVHQHLRDDILSNRVPPGTVLQEVPLAASLGVSRGPVREALGDLAAEGLVVITPRHGAVVSRLSRRDFLEAYQVRGALEVLAVRLAVPGMTGAWLEVLERTQARMIDRAARGDALGFFDSKVAFHEAWVNASGNAKLLDIYQRLMAQLVLHRRPSGSLRGGIELSIREHQAIIDAARSRDPVRTGELMFQHLEVPRRRLSALTDEEFAREIQQAMLAAADEPATTVAG